MTPEQKIEAAAALLPGLIQRRRAAQAALTALRVAHRAETLAAVQPIQTRQAQERRPHEDEAARLRERIAVAAAAARQVSGRGPKVTTPEQRATMESALDTLLSDVQ